MAKIEYYGDIETEISGNGEYISRGVCVTSNMKARRPDGPRVGRYGVGETDVERNGRCRALTRYSLTATR